MTTAELNTSTSFEQWAAQAASRGKAAGETPAFAERRRAAAEILRSLALPTRADELWRRTDFRTLEAALATLDPFVTPELSDNLSLLPAALLERLGEDALCPPLVVQVDGGTAFERSTDTLDRQGVIVCSLDRAVREHADKLEGHYGTMLGDDVDWYTAAGSALRSGGAFVYVPDGVEAAEPIRIAQWISRRCALPSASSLIRCASTLSLAIGVSAGDRLV